MVVDVISARYLAIAILLSIASSVAVSATDVSGTISKDTNWTLDDSPYVVTGNLLVSSGVTLSIEPGVQVKFDGDYYLRVDGTLSAIGNITHYVNFTSNQGSPAAGDWDNLRFTSSSTNSVLQYVKIDYSGNTLIDVASTTLNLSNCIFSNTSSWVSKIKYTNPPDSVMVNNNTFNVQLAISGTISSPFYVLNNTFDCNCDLLDTYGLGDAPGEIYIQKNTFSSSQDRDLNLGGTINPVISQNQFNDKIHFADAGDYVFENNIIKDLLFYRSADVVLRYNNIFGNIDLREYSYAYSDSDLNASHNWWNTTDTGEIDSRIEDYNDDFDLGNVYYAPVAASERDIGTVPSGLNASSLHGKISLNWNEVSGVSGYKVYYDTDAAYSPYNGSGANEGSSPIDVGDTTTFNLTNLTNDVTYHLAVAAYNASGHESWYSGDVSASPNPNITVCSSGCDYVKIQDAVDVASNGDTIYIKSGVYTDGLSNQVNVRITSKNLTLVGEDRNSTILECSGDSGSIGIYVLDWVEHTVNISRLTVKDCNNVAIGLWTNNSIVSNVSIINSQDGIRVRDDVHNTQIIHSTFTNNSRADIYLCGQGMYCRIPPGYNNNTLITDNTLCGLVGDSSLAIIENNTCPLNPPSVVLSSPSDDNNITGSNVTFSYVPTDEILYSLVTIDNCSLYDNFTGSWRINQTDSSITNNVTNNFTVSFTESGTYSWNVGCVDRDGNAANASSSWTVTVSVPTIYEGLVINEFLPHPSLNTQEWIELYNGGNKTANISGYKLDDVAGGGSGPYTIPDGTTIDPNNFTVFYRNVTDVVLSDLGDTVRLLSPSDSIIDNFTYYYSQRGISIGRETDGSDEWTTFELSTPGITNEGVNDTNPPSISLDLPPSGSTDSDGNVFLVYTPTDQSLMSNCVLYTNVTGTWAITQIDTTVLVNSGNSFGVFGLSDGTYLWNVQCTDDTALSASAAQSKTFIVNQTADQSFNQQLNLSLDSISNVTSNDTNVTLEFNATENVTDAYISISSYSNNTRNVSLSVRGLNRFITVEASTELEETLSNYLLRIYYTDAEVASAGLNESNLGIHWYNESTNTWQLLNENTLDWVYATGVNTTGNYIWANVAHFSDYTIGEAAESQTFSLTSGWNLISLPLIL